VISEVAGGEAWTARHGGSCSEDVAVMSRKDSRSLLFPRSIVIAARSAGDGRSGADAHRSAPSSI
jgi:hypothetical protein